MYYYCLTYEKFATVSGKPKIAYWYFMRDVIDSTKWINIFYSEPIPLPKYLKLLVVKCDITACSLLSKWIYSNDKYFNLILLKFKSKITSASMPSISNASNSISSLATNDIKSSRHCILHRPKRKMRQTFYKKIKNLSLSLFGDVKAPLKGVILFDDYNLLWL